MSILVVKPKTENAAFACAYDASWTIKVGTTNGIFNVEHNFIVSLNQLRIFKSIKPIYIEPISECFFAINIF